MSQPHSRRLHFLTELSVPVDSYIIYICQLAPFPCLQKSHYCLVVNVFCLEKAIFKFAWHYVFWPPVGFSKTFISKHLGLPPELQSELIEGWRQASKSTWVSSSREAPSWLICMMRLWLEGKESIIWNKTFSMSCYRVLPYALSDKTEALRTMWSSVAQTASKSGEIMLSVRSLKSQTLITWNLLTIFIIYMMKHNCIYVADYVVIVTSLWNTYRRLGVYYFYAVVSLVSLERALDKEK